MEKKKQKQQYVKEQKTFYWKVVLQKVFEIIARRLPVGLREALYKIPCNSAFYFQVSQMKELKKGYEHTMVFNCKILFNIIQY